MLLLSVSSLARAAGFDARLEVSRGRNQETAGSQPSGPRNPLSKRASLSGTTAEPFTAKWKITRSGKDEAKEVLVVFYVVKIDRPGQAAPQEPNDPVVQSALTMDFPPGDSASATQPFRIDQPGVYLVRIETRADPAGPALEHAEIELVVKG